MPRDIVSLTRIKDYEYDSLEMRKFVPFAGTFLALISASVALAEENTTVGTIDIGSAQGDVGILAGTNLNLLFGNAITIIFVVAAILVLVMLIWGGIEWVLSGGDKEKVANARKRIIASLIGLAIIALAFLIVRVVGQIFSFDVLRNVDIPALDKPK